MVASVSCRTKLAASIFIIFGSEWNSSIFVDAFPPSRPCPWQARTSRTASEATPSIGDVRIDGASQLESPSSPPPAKTAGATTIIPPNGGFRTTRIGEVSMASFNALAPSYNVLSLSPRSSRRSLSRKSKNARNKLQRSLLRKAEESRSADSHDDGRYAIQDDNNEDEHLLEGDSDEIDDEDDDDDDEEEEDMDATLQNEPEIDTNEVSSLSASQLDQQQKIAKFLENDRATRYPAAIQMAKQTNADVLCLQEVEGGVQFGPILKEMLAQPISDSIAGYDSLVFCNMLPKREDHVVGLCIAWRSARHRLIASKDFRRGMVVQLEEVMSEENASGAEASNRIMPATFCVGNVHLPARPSNILGRLKAMSKAITTMSALDHDNPCAQPQGNSAGSMTQNEGRLDTAACMSPTPGAKLSDDADNHSTSRSRHNPLDGLLVVAGDFNSDPKSAASQLLMKGAINYGKLLDRTYRATLTKASAYGMKHDYRFRDVYDSVTSFLSNKGRSGVDVIHMGGTTIRNEYAPVTVSLHGHAPGCMDQMFFAASSGRTSGGASSLPQSQATALQSATNKRKTRRQRNIQKAKARLQRQKQYGTPKQSPIYIDSLLSTIDGAGDHQRLNIINSGLPNLDAGFPSDHMPVGALFAPRPLDDPSTQQGKASQDSGILNMPPTGLDYTVSTTTAAAENTSADLTQRSSTTYTTPGGVSSHVRRRREAATKSISVQRRHNMILRVMAEWLQSNGAAEMIRDKPLYKWPWTVGLVNLKKKSRAPDLCCVVGRTLVVLEVTVSTKPNEMRRQKLAKYEDLVGALSESHMIRDAGLEVGETFAIVLRADESDDGEDVVPTETFQDVARLARLLLELDGENNEDKVQVVANSLCDHLRSCMGSNGASTSM